jgi:cellulose synthase/poly-beta-1,6-N-acetylglucosamine synthase-like glycosyltransferase
LIDLAQLLQDLLLTAFPSPSFWLIVSGLVIILINDLVFFPLAIIHERLQRIYKDETGHPLVSIIVPARNEEKNIKSLLETLLDQSYRNLQIIVVNDGSVDNTHQVVLPYLQAGKVQLIDLPPPSAGKHGAINAGLAVALGDIVVVVDADTLLERKAIEQIVKAFRNPNVFAVAGNVKVGNRVNLLTRLQALEYIRDINIPRRAFDLLDISLVIPGPLGAFKRKLVSGIGEYDPDTVTEDFDITVKAHKARDGELVASRNITDAIAYTEAPERLSDLYKQRRRWYGGMLQVLLKHRHERLWRGSGSYSMIGIPYTFFSLVIVPFLELAVSCIAVYTALTGGLAWVILAVIIFAILETLTSLLALTMDKDDLSLAAYSPLYVLGYRQLLNVIRVVAFISVATGKLGWSRAQRYGEFREKLRARTSPLTASIK